MVFELAAAAGGQEAALFNMQLFRMYTQYFEHHKWPYTTEKTDFTTLNGCRFARVIINQPDSFAHLVFEGGVHRVQRKAVTSRDNKMHTSTATIAVMPLAVVDFKLDSNDLILETKRSNSPGGQQANKSESAVRITHKPTGIVAESQETKHQAKNKNIALLRLEQRIRDKIMAEITDNIEWLKKGQIKNAERSEKIRTYHYIRDELTDHRTKKSYPNMKDIINGNNPPLLDTVIKDVQEFMTNKNKED